MKISKENQLQRINVIKLYKKRTPCQHSKVISRKKHYLQQRKVIKDIGDNFFVACKMY